MNKFLSAFVAVVMLMSAISSAVMAKEDKMAEILKTVKERIEIPAELEEFESSSYEDAEEGVTTYYFSWSSDNANMFVSCTDTKIITSYGSYSSGGKIYYGADTPSFPKSDKDAARAQAQEFVDKINPNAGLIVGEGEDNLYSRGLYFPVTRERNGIAISGDNGRIGFDEDNQYISEFYISWSNADEFEGEESGDFAVKSSEDAQKAFNDKLGFELVYKNYFADKKMIFYPAYVQKYSRKYIDAVTGEVFEPKYGRGVRYANSEDSKSVAAMGGGDAGFTPAESAELEKISGLISKDDAEKKVRQNKFIEIPDDYALVNIWLGRNYCDDEFYTYNMQFRNRDDEYTFNGISVSMNAKTGDIYSINKYAGGFEKADEESMKQALAELAPSISDKYAFDGENMSRYENGIRVENDYAIVWVDENGEPVSFSVDYISNAEFPPVESAISIEEASQKIFESVEYTKKYFPQNDKKAYLAYSFDGDVNLNALTGKMVGYNNEEITDDLYTYSDIDGHYAKEQIEKLAKYNIGFEGGKFLPDENITEYDFNELMSKIFYRVIITRRNNDNSDNEQEITRERAAVLMIEAIGAGEYAKYDDIYTKPFDDVEENKGYISLLTAMGVVNGDENGNFNPQRSLTRAEAAVMAYNYLNK